MFVEGRVCFILSYHKAGKNWAEDPHSPTGIYSTLPPPLEDTYNKYMEWVDYKY